MTECGRQPRSPRDGQYAPVSPPAPISLSMAKRAPSRTATSRANGAPRASKHSSGANTWVKQTLRRMSLDEKLGQLLMVPFFGGFTSSESADYRELLRAVEEQHVGGFMLATRLTSTGIRRSQVYPTAALANQLQRKAKIPLLFGADFERGTVMRLEEGTSFPHAMAIAAAGSPQHAYGVGRITALEARAAGIHWIFAPDADVNSNSANPIINTRSFGEDARQVAEHVSAFVRGVEENGALATAKHFPGHGDTSTDSHLDLPKITSNRARLHAVELVPFRAAISAGVSAIMTGHLSVPALESNASLPATLSQSILTGVLRKELGFGGLIITDALDMTGVSATYSSGEVAVRAILAGVDVLLIPPTPDAVLAALREAVDTGRLTVARVEESVARILEAKAKLELHKNRFVDLGRLNNDFGAPEFAKRAAEIADRGVTLLRDAPGLVPLDSTRPHRALLVGIAGDADVCPAETFEREIRSRVDSLIVVRADTRYAPAHFAKLPPAEEYDVVIAALFVRVADRKGSIGLPDDQAELLSRILKQAKPVVVIGFGSPYLVERFPQAPVWLAAFSTADVSQRAAARALFGEIPVGGKLPVSVPGTKPPLAAGDGLARLENPMVLRSPTGVPGKNKSQLLDPVYELLNRAVAAKAFPGYVIAVGFRNELSIHASGTQTYEAKSPAIAQDTIYDVASLTKPVVTTTLIAMEMEAGRLNLDAPLGTYLGEWDEGPRFEWRRRVTLRHLLTHTSGLPGHVFYYKTLKSKKEIIARAISEPLLCEPGNTVEYSDPGFMLLGEILERIAGRALESLAHERVFAPLGMKDTMYNPPRALRVRIAPTGEDSPLRKRLLRGEAHDDNTFVMGGIAGHAGLFSTAGDLSAFCQLMLNGGIYAHHRLLRRATVGLFTAAQPLSSSTRALGWVVPTEPSASGRFFSAHSFGHAGFTGTSIWCDPEKELFVVLLTNRVHPSRANEQIQQVRPALHDAVAEAFGVAKPRSRGGAR